jgi:hypothetical protein
MLCVIVLLMIIDVIIVVVGLLLTSTSPPLGVSLPLLLYLRGGGRGYNMILIMILSLLAYFTHIFIDIIIYALESTSGSSKIF